MLGAIVAMSLVAGTGIIQTAPQWAQEAEKCGDPTIPRPNESLLATVQTAADDATPRRADDTTVVLAPCLPKGKLAEAGKEVVYISVSEVRSLVSRMSWKDETGATILRGFLTFTIAHERQHLEQSKSGSSCPSLEDELEADRNARVPMGPLVLSMLVGASFERFLSQPSGVEGITPQRCLDLLEVSTRSYAHVYDLYVINSTDGSDDERKRRRERLQSEYELDEKVMDAVLAECELAVEQRGDPCDRQRLDAILDHRREAPEGPPPSSWRDPRLRGPIAAFSDDSRASLNVSTGFGMHWLDAGADERRSLLMGPRVDLLGALWFARKAIAVGPLASYQALLGSGRSPEHRLLVGASGVVLSSAPSGRSAHGLAVALGWGHELRPGADTDGVDFRAGWNSSFRLRPRLHLFVQASYELLARISELRALRFHSHGGSVSLGAAFQLGRR
ncbi:MAG: hypothetical protein KC501_31290 [Myxococcales bacterium]|nr:hypothetical protein [Myxococcales bacterium]